MQQFFSNQPRPKKSRDNFHSNSRHITIMMLKNVLQEGRIVQRIAFLLCTQRPPVWFSALPRIFLLMDVADLDWQHCSLLLHVCVWVSQSLYVWKCLWVIICFFSTFVLVSLWFWSCAFHCLSFFNIWLTNKSFSCLASTSLSSSSSSFWCFIGHQTKHCHSWLHPWVQKSLKNQRPHWKKFLSCLKTNFLLPKRFGASALGSMF